MFIENLSVESYDIKDSLKIYIHNGQILNMLADEQIEDGLYLRYAFNTSIIFNNIKTTLYEFVELLRSRRDKFLNVSYRRKRYGINTEYELIYIRLPRLIDKEFERNIEIKPARHMKLGSKTVKLSDINEIFSVTFMDDWLCHSKFLIDYLPERLEMGHNRFYLDNSRKIVTIVIKDKNAYKAVLAKYAFINGNAI